MEKKKRKTSKTSPINRSKRAGMMIFFTISVILLALAIHFIYVSATRTVKGRKLSESELKHFVSNQTVQAKRGGIFDSTGQVLAENTTTYNLYAIVDKSYKSNGKALYVVNKKKTAKFLAKVIDMKESDILKRLNAKKGTFQVEFGSAGQNLSISQHDKIVAAKLPGLKFTTNASRLYPNGVFASQIVGLTSTKSNSKMTGIMGIEESMNKYLAGKSGVKTVQETATGVPLTSSTNKKVKDGDDVYLTLNYNLQYQLESLMSHVYKVTKPKAMTAMLVNAKTGAILAATQRPTFNASTKKGLSNMWDNLLVQDPIEPGSTMKVFTLSAAIDTGHWNPTATFKSGELSIGSQKVYDAEDNMGVLTYREGFARSSNVAFAKTEISMGPTIWRKYINKFRFLKATKTMLPNESAGSIVFNEPIEQADTAFGQGIDVTPMQIVQALTAVANNGREIRPYLVSKVVNPDTNKVVYKNKKKFLSRTMKKSTAEQVRKDMIDVVNLSDGTAKTYSLAKEGYQIAAKTGTAQIAINGKYTDNYDESTHSVEVLVPAKHPKFIFYMYLREPEKFIGGLADTTINTVFHPLILSALNAAKANSNVKVKNATVPDLQGKIASGVESTLKNAGLNPIIIGDSSKKITSQSISADTKIVSGQKIFVKTSGDVIMPNMNGWSISDVSTFASLTGIKLSYSGAGKVVSQSISAKSTIKKGENLGVKLQ
ncbi:penicillin-binding protein [Oenococcus oeni]|uniref:penicillin-binding protein n=1 Tax=Oenococcus oeni TaxID=1247 RepID=UPI000277B8C6|nr:penicillin-binding protein [Oenococcus oeni]AWW99386.1 PASTA domain-containing protein [Oenococcus oeni]EJO03609.1 cell division protein FtsI/penicillin-binding protein 2 [Oenococcus oeni AWRIB419]EJO06164.1 cell division protein FtsI/penicillin-binding protein 2 [Oenococcus oeni AWRIB553]EKP90280.1 cell division protein FtsI/penicillin-binding protein 2 [Oenococcus oeni DSM 20252 = AWRIB129]KEK02456.1 cell division protein FtsI [Oenococcus oeni]